MSILSWPDPQYWISRPFLRAVSAESYPSAANDISAVLASRRVRRPGGLLPGLHRLLNEAVRLSLWTAGMSRWTPLFPHRLHAWYSYSGTPDWMFETSTAQIFSFVTCRRQLVIKHLCRIARLWKCWSKNRQLSQTEKNKDLFFFCLPNMQATPTGRQYLASKSKTVKNH